MAVHAGGDVVQLGLAQVVAVHVGRNQMVLMVHVMQRLSLAARAIRGRGQDAGRGGRKRRRVGIELGNALAAAGQ
jgi:hypothetical protein